MNRSGANIDICHQYILYSDIWARSLANSIRLISTISFTVFKCYNTKNKDFSVNILASRMSSSSSTFFINLISPNFPLCPVANDSFCNYGIRAEKAGSLFHFIMAFPAPFDFLCEDKAEDIINVSRIQYHHYRTTKYTSTITNQNNA